jgi:hypothetical protein
MLAINKIVSPRQAFQSEIWVQGWSLTQVKHLSSAAVYYRLLVLQTDIRIGWKGLPRTNTIAYYEYSQITAVKSLINFKSRSQAYQTFNGHNLRNKLECLSMAGLSTLF